MKKILLVFALLLSCFAMPLQAQTTIGPGGLTASAYKTFLTLSNVENTALSTWAGTANITTLGTVTTATWNATVIGATYGGTGVASPTIHAVYIPQGSSAWVSIGVGTTGQTLNANTGADPSWGSPPAGTVTAITADQTAAVNTSYVNNKVTTQLVLTLPTTAAVGQYVQIVGGSDVGGWKLAQAASVKIHQGANTSTTGTGGYISSNEQWDVANVMCIVANTEWVVTYSMGTITSN